MRYSRPLARRNSDTRFAICDVVQVREQEVRVAADADLRQMHQLRVAAMPVDGVDPEPAMASRTRQLSSPRRSSASVGMLSP